MAAPPSPAGGIYVVEAYREAEPSSRISYAVVSDREHAAELVRAHLGEGWNAELSSRRLSQQQAAALNFRVGEPGAIRELPALA